MSNKGTGTGMGNLTQSPNRRLSCDLFSQPAPFQVHFPRYLVGSWLAGRWVMWM